VVIHTIEVGARGWVHEKTALKCFRSLGFSYKAITKVIRKLSLLSVRASLNIYAHRKKPIWEYLPTTTLLRTSDCTLNSFEKLRLRLTSLTPCKWIPSKPFPPKSKRSGLETIYEQAPSARDEALELLSSIASGASAELADATGCPRSHPDHVIDSDELVADAEDWDQ
jgi:hypothetical protein